MLNLAHLS
jgi:hypothetical protein